MNEAAADGSYANFANRLIADGLVSDPWIEGRPRFATEMLVLSRADHAALVECAEAVAAAHDELVRIVAAEPELIDGFFGLTATQKLMWALSTQAWHGIARADVFLTQGGPVCCELNSDTPSGEPDALAAGLAVGLGDQPGRDPNRLLEDRFAQMVATYAASVTGLDAEPSIGIVYPTELTEDLALVALYRRWLEARGARVTLGSPYNLRAISDGRVALFDTPCDVILRHYKTDWWGERRPVWRDEAPPPDAEPLTNPLRAIGRAMLGSKVAVVNPFGAVLPQNKRALAFLWEEKHRFSSAVQDTIRRFVPFSVRLERIDAARLIREREAWVLKSDYGCEGDEVIVGAETDDRTWQATLTEALPTRWIAQRHFSPRRDPENAAVNFGVYLVAGRAAGLYCRRSRLATDRGADSVAVCLAAEGDGT